MKILVTGRQGQLAQSLAERGGGAIVLAGRPELDLAIRGSARAVILAAEPQLIVNAAAYTAVDLAESEEQTARTINADGAGEVAAAAQELGVPVVHISTDYVFDGRGTAPYTESAPTNPINAYGRTKQAGEEAIRSATRRHLILRTSWVFSPFGRNFVRTIIELANRRDNLSVVADQFGSPTSAFDLADAILAVARRWKGGDRTGLGVTYHVVGAGVASWFDVALAVQKELACLGAKSAAVTPIATADWPTAARRPAFSALDASSFTRDFSHPIPDWRISLGAIVARLAS